MGGGVDPPPHRMAWGWMQGWIEKFSSERVNKTASLSFTLQYTFPPPPSFPSPPSHSLSFPKLTPHPFSLDTRPHYYPSWIVRAQTFEKMFIIKQRSKYLNKCFQEVSLCRLYGWDMSVTLVGGGDFNVGGFLCLRLIIKFPYFVKNNFCDNITYALQWRTQDFKWGGALS